MLLRMTNAIVFGQLPVSLVLGANWDWSFDVLDILVPHKHIHAVALWFEKASLRKVDGTYLTSANGDVRLMTLPPDLGRANAADVFANTCDQTFFSQSGLTIVYPLNSALCQLGSRDQNHPGDVFWQGAEESPRYGQRV